MNQRIFSLSETAEILNVDKETLRRWDNLGKLKSIRNPINNYREYRKEDIVLFEKERFISMINLLQLSIQKKFIKV